MIPRELYDQYQAIEPHTWWAISNWMLPKGTLLSQKWQLCARRADSGILIYVFVDWDYNVMISDGWHTEPCPPEQFKAFCEGRVMVGGCEITMSSHGVWFDSVSQMLGFMYI